MQIRRRRSSLTALGFALALTLTGCAGDADEPVSAPQVEDPPPRVLGLLIDDGTGWRLCELVLESYPPQCGGERLVVDGLDPSWPPFEESGGVRWPPSMTAL